MKILYLHQYFVTPQMGGGVRSYEMGRRLVDMGHDVEVVTADQTGGQTGLWRKSVENGISVNWANVRYDNKMGFARRIASFVIFAFLATYKALTTKADVIFATSTPLTIAVPALIASFVRGKPFVFEVRDMWPDVPIAMGVIKNPAIIWLLRLLENATYKRAAHIVTIAPGMADDIVARGIPRSKTSVISQGCDPSFFGVSAGNSPRDEHAWLGTRKLVFYAGAIGLANGVDYLVRVAAKVQKIDPEIRFVVIGAGKQKDIAVAQAQSLGVLDSSFFFFDKIAKTDLVRWFHAADMHVALFTGPRAIWKDAAQNKFFDALSAGKPVANNFVGWQSEFAVKEGVGIILDSKDEEKAAQTLVSALHDDAWLASVPNKTKALVQGELNRDLLAKKLEEVLKNALQIQPAKPL